MADSSGAWRDGWTSTLTHQERILGEFELLYTPIVGSTGSQAVQTPQVITERTTRLHEEYVEMRKELLDELNTVDEAIIRPTIAAKDFLEPMKRTIKKREDRKVCIFLPGGNKIASNEDYQLDYERNQNKYDSYAKKIKRSERDNISMAKAEGDLANARDIYTTADNTLRERLPLLLQAIYSLIPQILTTQIQLQNTILANYYTILHNFAQDYQFETPSPSMEQIVEEWEQAHLPVRNEMESMACLANGKAIKQENSQPQSQSRIQISRNASYTTNTSNNNTRPPSRASSFTTAATNYSGRRSSTDTHYTVPSQGPASPEVDRDSIVPSKPRIPSLGNSSLAPPSASHYLSPSPPSPSPAVFSPPVPATTTPMIKGYAPAGPKSSDYFSSSNHRFNHSISSPSSTPITPGSSVSPGQQSNVAFAAAAAAKKKPPPPPKPKPAAAAVLFVTALYDFGGQGDGDLVFAEGDRIRVVQKTGSTDDWWEGEMRGVRGSFPANYVE